MTPMAGTENLFRTQMSKISKKNILHVYDVPTTWKFCESNNNESMSDFNECMLKRKLLLFDIIFFLLYVPVNH